MSGDRGTSPRGEQNAAIGMRSSLTETPSTRRTALGMTAAATAAVLVDRAIGAPGSAQATTEVVESINGKTGKVTLAAPDVEAIPSSEAGKPEGVATLDGSGRLPEEQLPHPVVSGSHHHEDASSNIAIGSTLGGLTTGSNTTALGVGAAAEVSTASGNTAVGAKGLNAATTGSQNTVVGAFAGEKITTGQENVAIGWGCLRNNQIGERNVAIGYVALQETTGSRNIAVGFNAGKRTTTGESNVYIGVEAGAVNQTGKQNVAIGAAALVENLEGNQNVAVGVLALGKNSTGEAGKEEGKATKNVAVGYEAGAKNSGEANVFIGWQAGANETGNNRLYIANTNTSEPLIWGNFGTKELRLYTTKLGFYGVTPVARAAAIASPPEELKALKSAVDAMREALKKVGITE